MIPYIPLQPNTERNIVCQGYKKTATNSDSTKTNNNLDPSYIFLNISEEVSNQLYLSGNELHLIKSFTLGSIHCCVRVRKTVNVQVSIFLSYLLWSQNSNIYKCIKRVVIIDVYI